MHWYHTKVHDQLCCVQLVFFFFRFILVISLWRIKATCKTPTSPSPERTWARLGSCCWQGKWRVWAGSQVHQGSQEVSNKTWILRLVQLFCIRLSRLNYYCLCIYIYLLSPLCSNWNEWVLDNGERFYSKDPHYHIKIKIYITWCQIPQSPHHGHMQVHSHMHSYYTWPIEFFSWWNRPSSNLVTKLH